MSPAMRRLLAQLTRRPRIHVGIISGRSLASVAAKVRLPGVVYVGNHGLELRGGGLRFAHAGAARLTPSVAAVYRRLRRELAGIPRLLIENKRLVCGVHYRLAPVGLHAEIARRVRQAATPWLQSGHVMLGHGKQVVEVRPNVRWDKGDIVGWLRRRLIPARARARWVTVFFGDDLTDEDAFRALSRRDIGVFVGALHRPTAAAYHAGSPREIEGFLRRLLAARSS